MSGCPTCGGFGNRHDPIAHGAGEPCMCGTPFTCVADEHDRTVYESHQWMSDTPENRCGRCFVAWDNCDRDCGA